MADKCETESQVALTLAVQLPSAGGCGLDYVSSESCTGAEKECLSCASHLSELYEEGTLYVHQASLWHQVRPWRYTDADAARITMQGFAVRCDGTWFVFW